MHTVIQGCKRKGEIIYMKNHLARLLTLLVILTLCLSLGVSALAAPSVHAGTVSKSKYATNLNSKYQSTVTLSFPSAEVPLESDVVFVLDKSSSATVVQATMDMLTTLKGQLDSTNAKINVAVVIFNKEAHSSGWLNLSTQYSAIETAMKQEIKSGTNSHAGMLAGKALLDAHTNVASSRKYLIFVSDGISYLFNEQPTSVAWSRKNDGVLNIWVGPDCWKLKYGSNSAPASWDNWLTAVGAQIAGQSTAYEYRYDLYGTTPPDTVLRTPTEDYADYANSVDKALYLTAQLYKQCQTSGYNCYALLADQNKGQNYEWGPSFMQYLANGKTINFALIQNDILYQLGKGSQVVDIIGDTDDYNFNLIDGSLQLEVGNTQYPLTLKDSSTDKETYCTEAKGTDGSPLYTVYYYYPQSGDRNAEKIVLYINTNVTNFQRLTLSYKLQLTNPKTTPGFYGRYDGYGKYGYSGLYTNNSATLTPVSSDGTTGAPEAFNKPTVSYSVGPVSGPDSGSDSSTPSTGDNSNLGLWLMLMALSAAGAVVLNRRRVRR